MASGPQVAKQVLRILLESLQVKDLCKSNEDDITRSLAVSGRASAWFWPRLSDCLPIARALGFGAHNLLGVLPHCPETWKACGRFLFYG